MTIQQVLDIVDEMKANDMTRSLKIHFLTEIEQLIHEEILMKHEHTPGQEVVPQYTEDSDPGTVLLVPDKYAKVYQYWIMKEIDHQNREMNDFNNDTALFEQAYETFSDYWTRNHMPLTARRYFRL